jgi:hypothetical protein
MQDDSGGNVSVFGVDSIGHCEKRNSYKHMSNSEWLPRYRYLNLARTFPYCLFSDALDFCLWGWIKSEVYKRRVDTRDELLARILDTAALVNQREDKLGPKTCGLRTQVAKKRFKTDRGIFKRLLGTAKNLPFLGNKFCI